MADLVNPYIAGAPVSETRMFFGRQDVFDWIRASLVGQFSDHILVIHGQRRVGKTSVLKQLGSQLPERFIPVFFDLQGRTHASLDRFLWWLAREIVRVLKQDRDLDAPLPAQEAFTADSEYFENHFLPGLQPLLGSHSILLIFDEFDNLEDTGIKDSLARPLIDCFRRLIDNKTLNFIFSIGSSGRKLENMQASYTEFFKTALYKKISFLNRDQARLLVTTPVDGIIEYEPAAVEKIFEITFGHPYFTQLICHELFSLCQKTGQRLLSLQDVGSILDDVIERGTVNLKFTWDEASDLEKWVLAALAHAEKPDQHSLSDILKKQHVRCSNSDLASAFNRLVDKDILTPDYHFVIQLLQRWLLKNRPLEQVREELTEVNPIANRYIEIGLEFKNNGSYEKAVESFQQALAVDSDNIQAQGCIGQVYFDQQDYEKAIFEFGKGLLMDDEDVVCRSGLCEAHLAVGDLLLKRGRPREAVQSWQRVLEINAGHTDARQRLADLHRQKAERFLKDGRLEEAHASFIEALKYTPGDPLLQERNSSIKVDIKNSRLDSLLSRAAQALKTGHWEEAVSAVREVLAVDPGNAAARQLLADIGTTQKENQLNAIRARAARSEKAGRLDDAVASWNEYLLLEPADPAAAASIIRIQSLGRQQQLDSIKSRALALAKAEKYLESVAVWKEYLLQEPADPTALASIENLESLDRRRRLDALESRARAFERSEKYTESLAAWEEYSQVESSKASLAGSEMDRLKKLQQLEQAYASAESAFSEKDFATATRLYKDVILMDEDYKDATRMMAESVKLRRTAAREWQVRELWLVLGLLEFLATFALTGLLFALMLPSLLALFINTSWDLSGILFQGNTPVPSVTPSQTALVPTQTLTDSAANFSWTQLSSLPFAPEDDVTDIVVEGNINGKIYISMANSGIYWSTDGANSWSPMNTGLDTLRFDDLVLDPINPSVIYAAASDGRVYKSTDHAHNWFLVHQPYESARFPYQLAVASWNNQVVFEGGNKNLYRSDNGGQTWRIVNTEGCPNVVSYFLQPQRSETITAASFASPDGGTSCTGGIYESSDGGNKWKLTGLKGYFGVGEGGLVVGGAAGDKWFVNASAPSGSSSAFRSQDAGKSWQPIFAGGLGVIRLNSADALQVYGWNGYNLDISYDGGSHWNNSSLLGPPYFNATPSFAVYGEGQNILMGGHGIFLSKDGGVSWEDRSLGLGLGRLELKLDSNHGWPLYLQVGSCWTGGLRDRHPLYFSTDGKDFKNIQSGSCGLAFDAGTPMLYRTSVNSIDQGASWSDLDTGSLIVDPASIIWEYDFLNGIFASPVVGGDVYMTTASNLIHLSHNRGATWTRISSFSIGRNPRLFFDAFGEVVYANAAYRFHPGGDSWNGCGVDPINSAAVVTTLSDQVIAIDPRDNMHLFAATSTGILESSDGCNSWRRLTGTGSSSINALVIDPTKPGTIYAAADTGVFISFDGGGTWQKVTQGFSDGTVVYSLVARPSNGIFVATSAGLFQLEKK
jgi:tetratricopeptide (TPR) repeat protein/photosystem II stability/assembly factor-like uncharacterized protein